MSLPLARVLSVTTTADSKVVFTTSVVSDGTAAIVSKVYTTYYRDILGQPSPFRGKLKDYIQEPPAAGLLLAGVRVQR